MVSLSHALQTSGNTIMSFLRPEYPAWLRDMPAIRRLVTSLDTQWDRMQHVMTALETAHLLLADQDEYEMDAITFSMSQDTVLAIQHAITSLSFLRHWQPHSAAPDTHDAWEVFLEAMHHEERHNTEAFRHFEAGEALVLYNLSLRNKLTRHIMSLTVLT